MTPRTRIESPLERTSAEPPRGDEEASLAINGLEQVLEMLRHADPVFRNSLLRRLQARDPALARKLANLSR